MNMKKYISILLFSFVQIMSFAQASGGQIKRPQGTTKKNTNKISTPQRTANKKNRGENADDNVERKYKEMSIIALEQRANQGDAMAQFYYGHNFALKEDYENALIWFFKAAHNGLIRAQLWVAFCLYNGKGISRDTYGAKVWLEEAANNGSSDAKEYLRTWF